MELLPLIIIIPLRIILQQLYVFQKIAISRENSPSACSNNSRDTRMTLNCLIRCKKTSKDVTLNHNGSSISDPPAIAELFNSYFSNISSILDRDIPHSITSPLYFLGAPVENSFFCPPSDSEEIVNQIRRQKSKSTNLMNIPVFIYKIIAP